MNKAFKSHANGGSVLNNVDKASTAMYGKTYDQLTNDQQIRFYESLKIHGNQNLIQSHRNDIQKNQTKKQMIKNLANHDQVEDFHGPGYLTKNNKVINHWANDKTAE